ncbi:MAG: hypothetical protein HY596_01180 [Candidatus Omnitrophica bacterium]|nr:hypothetical protein [Candidatus Omnitrophota bacterium]
MTEYAVLIGLLTAAVLGMQLYLKRGIQAGVKVAADQMSPHANDPTGEKAQVDGMRYESGERSQAVVATGSVLERKSAARTLRQRTANMTATTGGGVQRQIATDTAATSGVLPEGGSGVASRSEVVVDVR